MSGRAAAKVALSSRGVADVALDERRAAVERRVEVLALARGEVVEDDDLVAAVEQGVDEVGADEAGAAGDECTHGRRCYA